MGGLSLIRDKPRSPDAYVLFGVAALMAACIVALSSVGVPALRPGSYLNNALIYFSAWFFFELWPYGRELIAARPDSPLRFTAAHLRRRWPIYARGLPFVCAAAVFMPLFSAMKAAIPLFHPYTWDAALIAADRALFGMDAWQVLQPVLGFPIVTAAVALAYHCWFLLLYAGTIYFAAYQADDALRRRYFAGFFAIWAIVGILAAIGFASVGPCFVGPILGLHTFDAQSAYLHAADQRYPVLVVEVQDRLLAWYHSHQYGLGRGITAMPSMHVALATLFWLAVRRVSRVAGWLFGAFAIVIFVASVHLGYHYAVDGIAAFVMTWLIWRAAGYIR